MTADSHYQKQLHPYNVRPVCQKAKVVSNSNPYQQQLDASGLECPMPLLKTKLALKQLQPGEVLWVTATDAGSWRDIHKFTELTHHTLIKAEEENGCYQYWIKKGA